MFGQRIVLFDASVIRTVFGTLAGSREGGTLLTGVLTVMYLQMNETSGRILALRTPTASSGRITTIYALLNHYSVFPYVRCLDYLKASRE